jgi:hypothetical protein
MIETVVKRFVVPGNQWAEGGGGGRREEEQQMRVLRAEVEIWIWDT